MHDLGGTILLLADNLWNPLTSLQSLGTYELVEWYVLLSNVRVQEAAISMQRARLARA